MRLIDADRLLDRCIFYHLPNGRVAVPVIDVQHAPTVEPRPRGEWLPDNRNYYEERFVCSVCRKSYEVDTCMGDPTWDFCPGCGADMREEEQE